MSTGVITADGGGEGRVDTAMVASVGLDGDVRWIRCVPELAAVWSGGDLLVRSGDELSGIPQRYAGGRRPRQCRSREEPCVPDRSAV